MYGDKKGEFCILILGFKGLNKYESIIWNGIPGISVSRAQVN